MPIDPTLCRHMLAILLNLRGNSMPTPSLAFELETRSGRLLTTQELADTLTYCRQSDWIAGRKDDFGRDVWWITEAGRNKAQTWQ